MKWRVTAFCLPAGAIVVFASGCYTLFESLPSPTRPVLVFVMAAWILSLGLAFPSNIGHLGTALSDFVAAVLKGKRDIDRD